MGVFFESRAGRPSAVGVQAIRAALETDPARIGDLDAEARSRAAAARPEQEFKAARFLGALAIFAALLGGGIATDAVGLDGSSKALYGFAATVFGVVVGLLGGERSAGG